MTIHQYVYISHILASSFNVSWCCPVTTAHMGMRRYQELPGANCCCRLCYTTRRLFLVSSRPYFQVYHQSQFGVFKKYILIHVDRLLKHPEDRRPLDLEELEFCFDGIMIFFGAVAGWPDHCSALSFMSIYSCLWLPRMKLSTKIRPCSFFFLCFTSSQTLTAIRLVMTARPIGARGGNP